MADEVDQANDLAEMALQHALRMALKSGPLIAAGSGACLYCEEDIPVDRRWCGPECRDAWDRERARA